MKVLLVNPARYMKDTYINPPVHLLYIAQSIRRTGHEAEIVDVPYLLDAKPNQFNRHDDSVIEHILSKEFDILGIGSVVSSYYYCETLVKTVREKRPGVPIIVGGSVGLPVKELWEENAPVDYICESDGELVIEKFMRSYPDDIDAVKKIPGLHYLDENGKYVGNQPELPMNLDYIPFLEYDEVDIEYFIDNQRRWVKELLSAGNYEFSEDERFLPLIMSRGCVYNCTFCFHFNRLHRKHSPEYIADNVRFLMEKYGATAFYILDDLTIINKKWLTDVCDKLIEVKSGARFFSGGGKPGVVDLEILEHMKAAGFRRISYGIESGSQTILDIMKKQTKVEDNYQAIQLTKQVGMPFSVNIVFGMPGETIKTMTETQDLLIRLDLRSQDYYAALAVPYPGSALFEEVQKKGIIKDTREYLLHLGGYGDYRYNLTDLPTAKFLKKVIDVAFQVDAAHYKRRKRYLKVLKLMAEKYLKIVYQALVPIETRERLHLRAKVRSVLKVFSRS